MKKFLITRENIEELAKKHLENTPLYITGIKISDSNGVSVSIDGDEGVKISDCVALSRFIESSLDREAEDFFGMRDQRTGQLLALEVFRDQRVVRRLQAVLHRQVERGRCLAAAAHAHQDHIG